MSFRANVLKIMIASAEEVSEERKIVTGAIYRWNDTNATMRRLVLLPIKWETQNTLPIGVSPQTVINRQILDEADIVIGIFGTPTGTPAKEDISGIVREIKKHVAAGKTAKVYFSEVRVSLRNADQSQYALVQKFREELDGSGLSESYESMQEFRENFEHHLALEMNQPRYRWLDVLNRPAAAETQPQPQSQPQPQPQSQPQSQPQPQSRPKTPIVETHVKTPIVETHVKTAATETHIVDEAQKNHADDLLRSVGCVQRDLLRFLLQKGGIARGDVIARSRTLKSALEMNGLCGPLEQVSLLTRTADQKYGYSTLAVNERMMETLKISLFPRDEDDPPFFEGI
jgi:hypothetical protein